MVGFPGVLYGQVNCGHGAVLLSYEVNMIIICIYKIISTITATASSKWLKDYNLVLHLKVIPHLLNVNIVTVICMHVCARCL